MIRTAVARIGSWFLAIVSLGLLAGTAISGAHAQSATFVDDSYDHGLDVHLFRPAVDSKGFIGVNGSNILGDRDYSFGLVLDMGYHIFPYRAFDWNEARDPEDAKLTDHLVTAAITGTLHFNYGIANTFVVGLQVPIMVVTGPNVTVPGI